MINNTETNEEKITITTKMLFTINNFFFIKLNFSSINLSLALIDL